MALYIGKRVLYGFIAIWIISILSFIIIQLPPGDYVSSYIANLAAQGSSLDQAEAENLRIFYGLDKPWHIQYLKWASRIVTGDLGYSFEWEKPVMSVIQGRILTTVLLALFALVFTWLFAIPIGIYSAVHKYSIGDYLATFLGFLGLAIPDFLIALIAMWFGYSIFGWSVGGLFSPEFGTAPWSIAKFLDLMKHLWVPVIILGTAGMAAMIRVVRANLLDELSKPYVVTARAKGISEWKLIMKYPVRMALNPVISMSAYLLPYLISGSVIVSVVLSLPTLGPTLLKSLLSQDSYLAGGIIFLIGIFTILGTLISDLLLLWIDPRIKFEAR
ncbi:MAG: ABC transporter permease [Chloroflexi bacterium]|nr:ABC transporter permease [Chloroflexota bacterium]|tara:strand:+ start:699 stop:1688 length:990 start_codon:yes stop_codon:yes gene_type:complete